MSQKGLRVMNVLENQMKETADLKQVASLPDDEQVLTFAVARAADLWELTNETLGKIIGVSSPTASRIRSGQMKLTRDTKTVWVSTSSGCSGSLDTLTGSDEESAISLLTAENTDLDGRPIDRIQTVKGLAEVSNYIDGFRAKF